MPAGRRSRSRHFSCSLSTVAWPPRTAMKSLMYGARERAQLGEGGREAQEHLFPGLWPSALGLDRGTPGSCSAGACASASQTHAPSAQPELPELSGQASLPSGSRGLVPGEGAHQRLTAKRWHGRAHDGA